MSTARSKTGKQSNSVAESPTEVLTLSEAAAYLRVAEAEVVRLANQLDLPGRAIGGEWRFLKSALQDWLRTPVRKPGNEAFLALAGAWKDDPDIDQIVRDAMQRRGRSMAESDK